MPCTIRRRDASTENDDSNDRAKRKEAEKKKQKQKQQPSQPPLCLKALFFCLLEEGAFACPGSSVLLGFLFTGAVLGISYNFNETRALSSHVDQLEEVVNRPGLFHIVGQWLADAVGALLGNAGGRGCQRGGYRLPPSLLMRVPTTWASHSPTVWMRPAWLTRCSSSSEAAGVGVRLHEDVGIVYAPRERDGEQDAGPEQAEGGEGVTEPLDARLQAGQPRRARRRRFRGRGAFE